MHNPDDKYPTPPVFEPSTSDFLDTTGPNEPSGPTFALNDTDFLKANLTNYPNTQLYN